MFSIKNVMSSITYWFKNVRYFQKKTFIFFFGLPVYKCEVEIILNNYSTIIWDVKFNHLTFSKLKSCELLLIFSIILHEIKDLKNILKFD